jgi:integrase
MSFFFILDTCDPEHIIKDNEDFYLNKFNEKTNKEVFIPIDKRLYKMLEKYNFKSPSISNQKFNDYLKEVFKAVGITDEINIRESIKGVMKDTSYQKCDIVSAHDGRRTWASINYLKGYPIGLLMQVTGHEKEETFLSYVGVSALEKARRLNAEMKKK